MKIQNNKGDIVDEVHGISIPDPYRWLEDPDKPEVKTWIEDQNKQTFDFLKDDTFQVFSDELVKNFKTTNVSNPVPVNGRYFYTERKEDQDQPVLYFKDELNGVPVKIFDPNGKIKGNTISIDFWFQSNTGRYMAYGISEGGDEMATLFIKDLNNDRLLEESIPRCRHSSLKWLPDDRGFFYTRNPRSGTVPKNEEHLHAKIYLHILGTNPDTDEMIFGQDRPKDDMLGLALSLDGKYLAISASRTWTENDVYIYNAETKTTKPMIVGIPSKFGVTFLSDKVLLNTNYQANNWRVLSASYDDMWEPVDNWSLFIPEREHLLQSVRVTKDKILVEYLVNACSEVAILNYEGKEIEKIPLPQYSTLMGISARREEEEFFYGVESFVFPKIIYRYDPSTKTYSTYYAGDNPLNPDECSVKQEWYNSKDGARVPVFIFHKKDIEMDGKNPTILYGYGGFGSSQTPSFMRGITPWLLRGGIFAIANIRGGEEFGEHWHKSAIKEKKQNSYDDFIAAAEHLMTQKYTDSHHLGIMGGSNGGLLVCAVAVQRPDLFKAVCSRVPLTDMVRFSKFGMALRWVHEYGDPDKKDELENILKWSPYHNVKQGVGYPSFLFTTGVKDSRVDPLHARKMAAILQDAAEGGRVFIFTEIEAGHGGGKPIVKVIENQALMWSFFQKELDLKV